MGERAAEFLHADVFAGDGLDDVRAGDEHLAGLVDHDDEVGQRRGIHGTAGGRTHDDGDLRDDAGRLRVAAEDLAVLAEGHDALLDARAAGVEHADDGNTGLQRQVHHLDDLLARDLAERAAEDGEVLRVDGDLTAVNGTGTGDDGVTVGSGLLHAERHGAVAHELVELDEGTVVQQPGDALPGGLLALRVLLGDRRLTTRGHGFVIAVLEVDQLAGRRVHIGRLWGYVFAHAFHSIAQHYP